MKNVMFDFDGTLMDTWPGIEATLNASLHALGITVDDGAINRALVGRPLVRVFEELIPSDHEGSALAARKYRELFPRIGMSGARPYNGVVRMLRQLKSEDRNLFLVTARNEVIAKKMMKKHGLCGYFTWVRGELEGEVPEGKVHMVAEAVHRFGLDPGDCVMVGDRRYDLEAAAANGIRAIGVTYGYGAKDELVEAGASKLVGSVEGLKKILMERG